MKQQILLTPISKNGVALSAPSNIIISPSQIAAPVYVNDDNNAVVSVLKFTDKNLQGNVYIDQYEVNESLAYIAESVGLIQLTVTKRQSVVKTTTYNSEPMVFHVDRVVDTLTENGTGTKFIYLESGDPVGVIYEVEEDPTYIVSYNGIESELVTTTDVSTNYDLYFGNVSHMILMSGGSAKNVNIPADSTYDFPIGTQFNFFQTGAGQVTFVPEVGVDMRSASGNDKLAGIYSAASLVKIGANEWALFGDLTV